MCCFKICRDNILMRKINWELDFIILSYNIRILSLYIKQFVPSTQTAIFRENQINFKEEKSVKLVTFANLIISYTILKILKA